MVVGGHQLLNPAQSSRSTHRQLVTTPATFFLPPLQVDLKDKWRNLARAVARGPGGQARSGAELTGGRSCAAGGAPASAQLSSFARVPACHCNSGSAWAHWFACDPLIIVQRSSGGPFGASWRQQAAMLLPDMPAAASDHTHWASPTCQLQLPFTGAALHQQCCRQAAGAAGGCWYRERAEVKTAMLGKRRCGRERKGHCSGIAAEALLWACRASSRAVFGGLRWLVGVQTGCDARQVQCGRVYRGGLSGREKSGRSRARHQEEQAEAWQI